MILTPASGLDGPYFSRVAMSPGISCSAIEISLRPNSANVYQQLYNQVWV